jgi:hypothetical protein
MWCYVVLFFCVVASQIRPHLAIVKWKINFCGKKLDIPLVTLFCHPKMHLYAQLVCIIIKGAMELDINLVVWLESQDKSDKIAIFERAFEK